MIGSQQRVRIITLVFLVMSNIFFMLLFQSSQLLTELDEFSEQHGINASGLKNVFKSLLTIPNST